MQENLRWNWDLVKSIEQNIHYLSVAKTNIKSWSSRYPVRPCNMCTDLYSHDYPIRQDSSSVIAGITTKDDQVSLRPDIRVDKMLLGRKTHLKCQVNIISGRDKKIRFVTGCTVMPNGYIVLSDRSNKALKLLNKVYKIRGKLNIGSPWDVSAVDNEKVIVTLPKNQQLQYVHVFPELKTSRKIQLNKACWGVEIAGDEIYISCHNNPGNGEVRVLDLNGNLKRRLGVGRNGFMFIRPNYIAINKNAAQVFVSDRGTHIITCMTVDGHIIYQYWDDDMNCPQSLYCDSGDNILVCGWLSHNVQVATADGRKYDTQLPSSDLLKFPQSIAYRESDDTLVIGCEDIGSLLLFELTE